MSGNRRQGWAIYAAMLTLFLVAIAVVYAAELNGSPAQHLARRRAAANFEGKEVRFGLAQRSLCTAITTVASCGAVNAAFDSYTGIGGLVPIFNMIDRRGDLRRRRLGALRRCCCSSCSRCSSPG